MQFECDKDLTLDDSAVIKVYKGEEWIFSFACNMKELKDLECEVKRAKQKIQDEVDMRVIQKTKKFWSQIKKGGFIDYEKLLKEYREEKGEIHGRQKTK